MRNRVYRVEDGKLAAAVAFTRSLEAELHSCRSKGVDDGMPAGEVCRGEKGTEQGLLMSFGLLKFSSALFPSLTRNVLITPFNQSSSLSPGRQK